MTLTKNQIHPLTIDGLTAEGMGIGRIGGMAVFVGAAAPGDVVSCRVIKAKKNYAVGRIEEIIFPSPDRIPSDCPASRMCGGCAFRHMTYPAELRAKRQRVIDAMERIGEITTPVDEIVGATDTERYRNKAQFPIRRGPDGKAVLGFFAQRSHRVIPIITERGGDCLLHPKIFGEIARDVRGWADKYNIPPYDETNHTGLLRHLFIRLAEATGEIMVCLVINGESTPYSGELIKELTEKYPGIKSVQININVAKTNAIMGEKCIVLHGTAAITDRLCGLEFDISPRSFYQVNRGQAERLYAIAAGFAGLKAGETLLDLYCGTGTVGLSIISNTSFENRLIGVEIIPEAVEDARKNAGKNGVANARFICADAGEAASRLTCEGCLPDVVVLDPPRKGASADTLAAIAGMSPSRVVYISCDPATLARDLAILRGHGYAPRRITPVDMFPRTAHVETVVLLQRGDTA
ncbi:MAG: 23S rRNA (uracil(1939)-C(5))-methyltransferase RlmD [Oscillospiraceae bacterium]|nr:23S rRNA (uracil(1939)-C(5))-methyltransferase RlmD [Oscillospiraceae bacterium]